MVQSLASGGGIAGEMCEFEEEGDARSSLQDLPWDPYGDGLESHPNIAPQPGRFCLIKKILIFFWKT